MSDTKNARTSFGGLFSKRERWGLTGRGTSILLLGFGAASVLYLFCIYDFLAVSEPITAPVLAMEGWIHPSGARATIAVFEASPHRFVVTTGGPKPSDHGLPGDGDTWADSGAYWLRAAGLDPKLIRIAPSHVGTRDRTFFSAVALREWLASNTPEVDAVDVVTEGVHARRTRFLFEKALGPRFRVGIIATGNTQYDPTKWWRNSEGVREVLGETIAYLYARFFFHPQEN